MGLEEVRKEIDLLDSRILKLINDRMGLASWPQQFVLGGTDQTRCVVH